MAPVAGPIALAMSAYKLWRRLPAQQRKAVVQQVRRHGPAMAAQAVETVRAVRRSLAQKR